MHGPNDELIAQHKRSLQIAADRDEKQGPYGAEIAQGTEGKWHILKVVPGQINIAAAHLISRRFGIYQPHYIKRVKGRFGKADHDKRFLLFSSYIFIFVWDVSSHSRRILACPGVINFVTEAGRILALPDSEIKKIQKTENTELGLTASKPRRRRRNKHPQNESDIISISIYSAWSEISEAVEQGGDSSLKKALGL